MAIPSDNELALLHDHICQALSDPRRIQIMYALNESRRHVSAIADALGIPQPAVSRHLAVLRQRGLVSSGREGAAVFYYLADPHIIEILDMMRQLLRDTMDRQAGSLVNQA